jgi:hypothetical protein
MVIDASCRLYRVPDKRGFRQLRLTAEVTEDVATYFFESGAVGPVPRVTGAVEIHKTP